MREGRLYLAACFPYQTKAHAVKKRSLMLTAHFLGLKMTERKKIYGLFRD